MTAELGLADGADFRRRRAVVTAAVVSSLGVVGLALRESQPHPGRISSMALLAVGALLYVAPFAFCVDRAMRRGRTRIAVVAFIAGSGVVFLATRPLGSFSQAWLLFTMIVSIFMLQAIGLFARNRTY